MKKRVKKGPSKLWSLLVIILLIAFCIAAVLIISSEDSGKLKIQGSQISNQVKEPVSKNSLHYPGYRWYRFRYNWLRSRYQRASCETGYANCDRDTSNGCETKLGTNDNCGYCGNSCREGFNCDSRGRCVSSCKDNCESLGYECGIQDICGGRAYCGNCPQGSTCQDGSCVTNQENQGCISHSSSECYNGDVYWYNSCGVREEIKQDCPSSQTCQNGVCVAGQQDSSCSGSSIQACPIENGIGVQSRTCNNGVWSSWGICTATFCNSEYQISGNSCVPVNTQPTQYTCTGSSTQACSITNGIGIQSRTCDSSTGQWSSWSTCTLVSCNSGYVQSGNSCVASSSGSTETPPTPDQADYYVANNGGSDSNPGTITKPFKTINKAISVAGAGDLIYIRGGTYNEAVTVSKSGTASAPLTIAGYPGEEVIIDGQSKMPSGPYDPLFYVTGNYVVVKDLTVQRSYGMGMLLSGKYDRASNINSYRNMENGILVSGDYGIVENCDIGWNCLSNEGFSRTRNYWSTGLSAARHPMNATLRGNTVHDTWGEGLSVFEGENVLMEDNIVYDNQANVYLSDTRHTTLRRNIIYSTPGNPIQSKYQQTGIMIGDEQYNPASSDNTIVNNLVIGNEYNLYFWEGAKGGGLKNVLIAHNTFVNSVQAGDIIITGGTHSNSRFENNLMLQEGSVPIGVFSGSTSGLTFSNNLWSKSPPSAMSGAGDIIGDPKLIKTGPVAAGQVSSSWVKFSSDSPAINKAKPSEVNEDIFKNPRGSTPDIGAYEYNSQSSTSTTTTCSGSSTQSCVITNGQGIQSRTCNTATGQWSSWGTCNVVSCNPGYQMSGNSCAAITYTCSGSSTQACSITNGGGSQSRTCNTATGQWSSWGTCTVVSCNSGYVKSGNSCVAQQTTCTDTCASLGYQCGTRTICGTSVNCGTCPSGYTCQSIGICTLTQSSSTSSTGGSKLKYYGVDRGNPITDANYKLLSEHAVKTLIVYTDISAGTSEWQKILDLAEKYDFYVVILPTDWESSNSNWANCGWDIPYLQNPPNGDRIVRVKPMLDYLAGNPRVIGIIIAHEPFWSCRMTINEMASLKTQIKDYVRTKHNREFQIWNYIDWISLNGLKGDDIGKIMDVAMIWRHCIANAEGTCAQAKQDILNDRKAINDAGLNGKVDLVFLFQTFEMGSGYPRMPTAAEMHDYGCDFINTGALDGFLWYSWGACWYDSDLYCPASTHPNQNLWPIMNQVYDECVK